VVEDTLKKRVYQERKYLFFLKSPPLDTSILSFYSLDSHDELRFLVFAPDPSIVCFVILSKWYGCGSLSL
jgi:hypothetical protein